MSGLRIELETEGLELLSEAYLNAPEAVHQAALEAGREAVPILQDAIAGETPIDTGYLRSTEAVSLEGVFNISFTATAPYAAVVNAHNPYVERGTEIAAPRVTAIYDDAMDRLAETFFHGE